MATIRVKGAGKEDQVWGEAKFPLEIQQVRDFKGHQGMPREHRVHEPSPLFELVMVSTLKPGLFHSHWLGDGTLGLGLNRKLKEKRLFTEALRTIGMGHRGDLLLPHNLEIGVWFWIGGVYCLWPCTEDMRNYRVCGRGH